jgi:hypothetical protein
MFVMKPASTNRKVMGVIAITIFGMRLYRVTLSNQFQKRWFDCGLWGD